MKQSFIVYTDNIEYLEELTDAQVGQLYKAQIAYSRGEEPEISDPMVRLVFKMLKGQMDRDSEKYEGIVAQRKKAGENGAKKKWQDATNDSNVINSMAKIANAKSDMAKIANAKSDIANDSKAITEMANIAVNDNVTVNDTDNVSKSNDLDSAHEVKTAVQEKLEEYFDYLEDLDQKPVTLKARNVITQKLVSITDIESKQLQLIDEAMKNGWHNVYERGDPSAGKAKDGQQGEITDLDAWLKKQTQQNLSEVTS